MYGSGPRVATRYASAVGRKCRARTGSGLPVSGIVRRSSSRAARSRRWRGVSGRTTPWRRIASRSAFSTPVVNLPGSGQGGENSRASHERRCSFCSTSTSISAVGRGCDLRLGRNLWYGLGGRRLGDDLGDRLDRSVTIRLVVDAHQLLLPTPFREALEVPANGRAHVVEVTLLAHGRTFPASCRSPAAQRGEANVAVHTTASPAPRRPFARTAAAPT